MATSKASALYPNSSKPGAQVALELSKPKPKAPLKQEPAPQSGRNFESKLVNVSPAAKLYPRQRPRGRE